MGRRPPRGAAQRAAGGPHRAGRAERLLGAAGGAAPRAGRSGVDSAAGSLGASGVSGGGARLGRARGRGGGGGGRRTGTSGQRLLAAMALAALSERRLAATCASGGRGKVRRQGKGRGGRGKGRGGRGGGRSKGRGGGSGFKPSTPLEPLKASRPPKGELNEDLSLVEGSEYTNVVHMVTTRSEILAPEEMARPASWSTFANSAAGVWVGSTAAFNPQTGESEDLYSRQPEAFTITIDRVDPVRMGSGDDAPAQEAVVRHVLREIEGRPKKGARGNDDADEELDEEPDVESEELSDLILDEEPGLIFFEDGSYSRGPLVLGADTGRPDDIPDAPAFETTLVNQGHTRVRVASTLELSADQNSEPLAGSDADGDGALTMIRTTVVLEEWMKPSKDGLSEGDEEALEKLAPEEGALSAGDYLNPENVCGTWKVFTRTATVLPASSDSLDLVDPSGAGGPPKVVIAYSTEETEVERKPELSSEGDIALWLTSGVHVTLDFEGSNLCYRVGWTALDGQRLEVTRVYDADSCELLEVRHTDEIKGSWVGGRMESNEWLMKSPGK